MQQKPIRLAIAGANGRMGRQLIEACVSNPSVTLTLALVRQGSHLAGNDAGELAGTGKTGTLLQTDLNGADDDFDVLIDFTRPDISLKLLAFCRQHGKAMVTGTTGFNDAEKALIHSAGADIPVVFSANFSAGVNVLLTLLEKTTAILGQDSDIEIIEAHHRHKADAPSGTALAMGETIASALGKPLSQCAIYDRYGVTGARPAGSIGFATVRAGDIIGEHTALFASDGERVEISHKASSRMTFARGAIRAAIWLHYQPNGLYNMHQVLGL